MNEISSKLMPLYLTARFVQLIASVNQYLPNLRI